LFHGDRKELRNDHPAQRRLPVRRDWNPIDPALEQHPEGAPPMPPAR
jgi:hypothetical protein